MDHIPFISVEADNNYDLGFKIGKRLAEQIRKRVAGCNEIYREILRKDTAALAPTALAFLPATVTHYPNLVAELLGMSAGAGVPFESLMVLMCEEELLDIHDLHISKCTSIALRTTDGILVGHNEDWVNAYARNGLYVLRTRMGRHRSLSLSYIGSLAGSSSGLNSSGLCFTANSLSPGRFRYGVPIKFQFRAILDARTLPEAIRQDLCRSSIAGNTLYGWRNTRILDIEDFFGHHEHLYGKKFLIHTNHPLRRRDRNATNTPHESIVRYERAKEILGQEERYTLDGLKELLADHEAGICSHPDKHTTWGLTIASVIMNPKERWMEVCWTNPCRNEYTRYWLW